MRGMYVIFEGIDGSGKSTLAKRFADELGKRHHRTWLTAFPGHVSAAGRLIRAIFEGKETFDPGAMMWLFVAEGKDLDPQIRKRLNDGDWVVCDRHTMVSGLIYQGEVHGRSNVEVVTRPAHFTPPDRIYILDVPAEVALARRDSRGEARNTLYEPEKIDRLESMRAAYLALAKDEPGALAAAKVLDGTAGTESNLKTVLDDLGLTGGHHEC
jgi:dTMP kinase